MFLRKINSLLLKNYRNFAAFDRRYLQMDSLAGKMVYNRNGKLVTIENALAGKSIIIFYFSASWCEPCKHLLPKIKKIYQENVKRNAGFEIIYVSSDNEQDIFMKYFLEKHGGWYAVPIDDIAAPELRARFGVTHIPFIVVIKKNDGSIVTTTGRKEIEEIGINVLVTWRD